MLFTFIHIIFPKYFNWHNQLATLSLINKQMMIVHIFFIALTEFLMGLLCIKATTDLIETKLVKRIAFGFTLFWTIRFEIQFVG